MYLYLRSEGHRDCWQAAARQRSEMVLPQALGSEFCHDSGTHFCNAAVASLFASLSTQKKPCTIPHWNPGIRQCTILVLGSRAFPSLLWPVALLSM